MVEVGRYREERIHIGDRWPCARLDRKWLLLEDAIGKDGEGGGLEIGIDVLPVFERVVVHGNIGSRALVAAVEVAVVRRP